MSLKKFFLIGAALACGYTAGSWHLMYGSKISTRLVKKVSWSPSETIINFDEVGALPMIVARSKYPLFLTAMERDAAAFAKAQEEEAEAAAGNQLAKQNLTQIRIGMTRAEIVSLLGEPDLRVGPFVGSDGTTSETIDYDNAVSIILHGNSATKVTPLTRQK